MLYKSIDKDNAEIRLYGNIGSWYSDAECFDDILNYIESNGHKNVIIRMHCYGGSVFEGNAIGNAIKRSKLNISIAIDGIAASMGCFILPYLPAERVSISGNGFGMLHRPTGYSEGDADDHRSTSKLLDDIEKFFIASLSNRTGKRKEDIRKEYFDGKDHWLNADEMLALKLVGKITNNIAEIEKLDKEILEDIGQESVYSRFSAKLSKKNVGLEANTKNSNQNLKKYIYIMDKNLVITALGLTGVTAESSDTDVLSAVQSKVNSLTEKITQLEKDAKTNLDKSIDALIERAIIDKKIVASEGKNLDVVKASFKKVGQDSGLEALKNLIDAIPVSTSLSSQIKGGKDGTQVGEKTFEWYREHDIDALLKMRDENPDEFERLYKAEFKSVKK
jgi:ATP-dependent protease ClpP protease subunit